MEAARTIATFAVPYLQHLDKSGQPVGPLPPFAEDAEVMTALYKSMVLIRTFDGRAISLQRTGQLGTYPSCLGQEAIGTGVASVMAPNDVLLTMSVDVPNALPAGDVEQLISRLEGAIKERHADITRIFIEVQEGAHAQGLGASEDGGETP